MSKELLTILVAASPFLELRGAIPLAIGLFHFSVGKAFFLSYLGNIIPVIPLLWFWERISLFLMKKYVFWRRLLSWIFERTRKKTEKKFEKYAAGALVLLVAIPLPLTGAWTGSIAAFLFHLNWKQSFILISLGVLIAGIIVTILTILGVNLIQV